MWTHLLRTLVALLGVFPFGPGVVGERLSTSDRAPAIELVEMPPDFVTMVSWATDLFSEAGLELPPIRFVHHGDDTSACAGRVGAHHVAEGINVIDLCSSEASWPNQVMVLHETAHAWADHALTDDRKAAFGELRGWTYWRNHDTVAWHENGSEQAAEIMVWGLVDRPMAMLRIHDNSCDDLEAGYRVLTGRPPLHGFRDEC